MTGRLAIAVAGLLLAAGSLGASGPRLTASLGGPGGIQSGDLLRLGKIDYVSAADVVRCIGECRQDRVAVEEQHSALYIIHFRNDPDIMWLSVNSESPIFVELRLRHARWMARHPGWDGWIAF